jgi:hypothetical protein
VKPSEILREAALMVERDEERFGCLAIDTAAGPDFIAYERAMETFEIVAPEGLGIGSFWWPMKERHSARIIGLCLAAAIAESEGQ